MTERRNLKGQRFGRLIAVRYVGVGEDGKSLWECTCDCGKTVIVRDYYLIKGVTRSCGCLRSEAAVKRSLVHGHSAGGKLTGTYHSWASMITRCENPKRIGYENYGGRGITVCDRWRKSFANFLADMGERPPGTTLERKDNDGNYEPSNCKWASRKEQTKNRRHHEFVRKDILDQSIGLLKEAVRLIEFWHNMDPLSRLTDEEKSAAWGIYYARAPEMKGIREFLEERCDTPCCR